MFGQAFKERNMRTKSIAWSFVVLVTLLLSCKKDYLQRDVSVVQEKKDVFADPVLASRFADASYSYIINDYGRMGSGGQPYRGSLAEFADEAVSGNNEAGIVAVNSGAWMDGNQMMEASAIISGTRALPPYIKCFRGIRNANIVLANADKVDWTLEPTLNGDLIKAQQLALRAYFYFELAKRWGGMPLYDTEIQLDAQGGSPELDKPRATFEETIAFIEKDIDAAEAIFQKTTFVSSKLGEVYSPATGWNPNYVVSPNGTTSGDVSANNGRMDLGIVRALRSRVTLLAASPLWNTSNDRAKWEKAANAAKKVMDMNRYALHPTYRNILEVGTSPEYIMYVIRGPRSGGSNNTFFNQYVMAQSRGGSVNGLNPTQNHVDLYEMKNGLRIGDAGSGYNLQNPYINRDPRLSHNILYNGHPWQARPIETWYSVTNGKTTYGYDMTASNQTSTVTGYYSRKMWNENLNGSTATGLLNYVIMRYGEILLNYAEASNEAGNITAAIVAVNQIRARSDVNMPTVEASLAGRGLALNQANLRDFIRNERAVELAFEDIRWWDVLRWKKGVEIVAQPMTKMDIEKVGKTFVYRKEELPSIYQKVFLPYFHLYPIPRTEISKSNNLTQNPGWPTN